jgi:hypothetical protein
VFTWVLWQGHQTFHERSRRRDSRYFLQLREQTIVEGPANFEIGSPCDNINSGPKRSDCAPVRNLYRQIDRYPEGNAQDVDYCQSLVPQRIAHDMLKKKSQRGKELHEFRSCRIREHPSLHGRIPE